jgi:nucleoprotein TPR
MWFYQEKELLKKHNPWLDEELKAKAKNLAKLGKTNMDEMSANIAKGSLCDLTHDG